MVDTNSNQIVDYLSKNKEFFYDNFGVVSVGIFGSFVNNRQTSSSDIDIIVEFEKSKKNIHNFLAFKRFLENEFGRKVDLGFEHSLKPAIRDKVKGQILYV